MKTHEFDNTESTYSACQIGEAKTGDLLIIESEEIVGVAYCWPIAATLRTGELYSIKPTSTIQMVAEGDSMHTESISDQAALIHGYKAAQLEAAKRGWPIDPKQADNSINDLNENIQNLINLLDSPSEEYNRERRTSAESLMKERDALEKALYLQGEE